MRRMTVAPRAPRAGRQDPGEDGEGTVATQEPTPRDEMSGHVLEIIRAYRMGAVVEARDLCQKPFAEVVPNAAPRPAAGYVRNGVYHVADTAPRRN